MHNKAISALLYSLRRTLLVKIDNGFGYMYGYDLAENRPIEPVYCEITGYGLSLHAFLGALMSSNVHRDLVEGLSRFLMFACSRTSSSAVPYGFYPSRGEWTSLVYSFDNGIIAKGFFDVYKALGDRGSLECGLRICKWLVDVMQRSDGGFRAAYDYEMERFVDFDEWYGDGGCLHGKLAIPLLLAWRSSGNDKFLESVEKLLTWLLRLQLPGGAFRAKEGADYVFHHAHCYALEGLLFAWHMLGDDKYLDATVKGAKWLAEVQHKYGGIPDFYPHGFVKRLVSDATAQAVRIWLILYKVTCDEKWLKRAEKGLKFLSHTTFKKGSAHNTLPAYVYVVGPLRYAVHRVHTWSLMFAIQAFVMREHLGKLSLDEVISYLF